MTEVNFRFCLLVLRAFEYPFQVLQVSTSAPGHEMGMSQEIAETNN